MTKADYDYLIGMDSANICNMNRITGGDPDGKIYKLLSFAGSGRDIADPWYTGNFDETYADVVEGCEALLAHLTQKNQPSQSVHTWFAQFWGTTGTMLLVVSASNL